MCYPFSIDSHGDVCMTDAPCKGRSCTGMDNLFMYRTFNVHKPAVPHHAPTYLSFYSFGSPHQNPEQYLSFKNQGSYLTDRDHNLFAFRTSDKCKPKCTFHGCTNKGTCQGCKPKKATAKNKNKAGKSKDGHVKDDKKNNGKQNHNNKRKQNSHPGRNGEKNKQRKGPAKHHKARR